jgi:hypothetical protein
MLRFAKYGLKCRFGGVFASGNFWRRTSPSSFL